MVISEEWIARFNEKWVKRESGCWEWTAAKVPRGYGIIKIPGQRKQEYAHRLAYRILHGDVPDGLYVLHRCDNPGCVNPDHLFTGSPGANANDMKNKGRHLYGERNTNHVLTEPVVRQLKAVMQTGQFSQREVAQMFGVAQMTVSRIMRGQRWAHLA